MQNYVNDNRSPGFGAIIFWICLIAFGLAVAIGAH